MDDDAYWALVERARAESGDDSPETVSETLVALLVRLTPPEVVEAGEAFDRLSDRGYGFPLWGAAYLLNGGCSDDGFDDFRGWLVTRGRAVYDAALARPGLARRRRQDRRAGRDRVRGRAGRCLGRRTGS